MSLCFALVIYVINFFAWYLEQAIYCKIILRLSILVQRGIIICVKNALKVIRQ